MLSGIEIIAILSSFLILRVIMPVAIVIGIGAYLKKIQPV